MNTQNRKRTFTAIYWILNIIIFIQFIVLGFIIWNLFYHFILPDHGYMAKSYLASTILSIGIPFIGLSIMTTVLIILRSMFIHYSRGDIFTERNRKLIAATGILLLLQGLTNFILGNVLIYIGNLRFDLKDILLQGLYSIPSLSLPVILIFLSLLFKRGIQLKHENDLTI